MTDYIIENMLERAKDELLQYFKSFGLDCHYDFDEQYGWYDVSLEGKQMIQIETGTRKDQFFQLMVEYFTDAWDTPPIFLASNRRKKTLFKFCKMFPEFNEKISGLEMKI